MDCAAMMPACTTFAQMVNEIRLAYNLTRVMNIIGVRPLLAAIRA